MDPVGRETVESFQPELQQALATCLRGGDELGVAVGRAKVSDTTLKFRHEVAEALRVAGHPYDLDLGLGPGLSAELAIGGPRRSGALWLLDGPESFLRPFASLDGNLRLVPLELLRAELLTAVMSETKSLEMEKALASWEAREYRQPGIAAESKSLFGFGSRYPLKTERLVRLHWLEWADLNHASRLAMLQDPVSRIAEIPSVF